MLVNLHFRINGKLLGETKTGAVPAVGERVALEHGLRGRRLYRVIEITHQFTDSGVRRVDKFVPAPILVDLEEDW